MKFDIKSFDIKNADKRVLIGAGLGVVLVIILIIAVVVGAMNQQTGGQGDTQNQSETNDVNGTQGTDNTTEDNTEKVTEDETEVGTEVTGTENETESENDSSQDEEGTQGDGSQSNTTKPNGGEIIGTGSNSDPILEDFGDELMVTTIAIQPGTTVYYGIYGAGGLGFTINHPDAYVIYNGARYDAQNGVVSFVVGTAMANEAVYFEIGNKGVTETTFTINFTNQVGSRQNPHTLGSIASVSKSLMEGDSVGYFYKYIAEQNGTIRFYIVSATEQAELSVTNNSTMVNRTFEDEEFVKTDAEGNKYYEVEVTKGDELIIHLCADPGRRWKYPATDVVWKGVY